MYSASAVGGGSGRATDFPSRIAAVLALNTPDSFRIINGIQSLSVDGGRNATNPSFHPHDGNGVPTSAPI